MIVISLVGLALSGCNKLLVTVFLEILAVGIPVFFTTFAVGPMIIAPNYAGTFLTSYTTLPHDYFEIYVFLM